MRPKKRIVPSKFAAWIQLSACQRCTNWTTISSSCNLQRWISPNSSHWTLAFKCHRRRRKHLCVDSSNWWIRHCWRIFTFWICCSGCRYSTWPRWISKWWRRSSSPIWAIRRPKWPPACRSQPSPTSRRVLSCRRFVIGSKWRNDLSSSFRFYSWA